ncbi:DNA repair protein RecN [Aquisediminimonas profunda]|uniref:DNA repair protein RecN n=1 Tax=Aquisediminimonas profunda TaxID=1550733 RepID=UPI001C62A7D3|nr:DNA repair protein RecN [Aquisediminimonas profunda]
MLTSLSIRDVVLIETLDLDFARGLGVLTGETGAGKSILLDALGLALGDRADSGLVRSGVAQASVTASFQPSPEARCLLDSNDLLLGAGEELIVRRTVKADGGSRAFVNDQPVSAALLRELGGLLVEVHGQHDDRGLINPKGHRALLDIFARSSTAEVAAAYQAMRATGLALETARTALVDAERDRDWLAHAVDELRAFAPQPGEEAELAGRRATMQRGQKIADELVQVSMLLEDADGGLSKLRQAARILDRIAGDHPALAEALAAVDRAINEGSVAEDRLRDAAQALAYDPAALEADEARLFDLRALARKHRVQPDQLADLTEELAARHEAIEAGSEGLARLEKALADARDTFCSSARALTEQRIAAGAKLDDAVAAELVPLKLDSARFRTIVAPLPEAQWGPHGMDRVEFEISTNPGAAFGPLIKIASGGELSRFILALKVALAEHGTAATMIFDEIDRGVGGAVASAIGERLSRLAEDAQVIVVTHSPQVAARGDTHLLIAKSSDGAVTRTSVRALDDNNRREEIARMLSGAEVTDEARAQADRLLEAA